jgi:hypothetical protein
MEHAKLPPSPTPSRAMPLAGVRESNSDAGSSSTRTVPKFDSEHITFYSRRKITRAGLNGMENNIKWTLRKYGGSVWDGFI